MSWGATLHSDVLWVALTRPQHLMPSSRGLPIRRKSSLCGASPVSPPAIRDASKNVDAPSGPAASVLPPSTAAMSRRIAHCGARAVAIVHQRPAPPRHHAHGGVPAASVSAILRSGIRGRGRRCDNPRVEGKGLCSCVCLTVGAGRRGVAVPIRLDFAPASAMHPKKSGQ